MPDSSHEGDGRLTHPSVRYEHSDASFGGVFAVLVGGGTACVIFGYLVLMFFFQYRDTLDQARQSRYPLAPVPANGLPPEPRLEQLDRMAGVTSSNVYVRQKARLDLLDSYGPTDDKGYVHIPVDRAMRLLAGKLPSRPESRAATGMTSATAIGLLGAPSGSGLLLASAALFPGRGRAVEAVLQRRQNGLVTSGESNSGRMFKERKPRWLER